MNLAHPRLIRKTPYSDPFLSQPHALIDPSLAPRKAAGCISLSLVVTEVVKLNCLVEINLSFAIESRLRRGILAASTAALAASLPAVIPLVIVSDCHIAEE
ncbi:uncharacterized protein [Physcomitrium patens]|uniref:uncharacterized protein n=1 Tax=Physcomitrium patens TaxID=3218 RepID=UPI00024AAE09|nr:uncharacterized protein LOC112293344 [Physcomitrium patens]|eukprot:XP_024398410.1 uncharacterized protein LOC112293344 [Physcomitrella patens]